MKSYLSSPSARRLGFAAATIGFVILCNFVRSGDARVAPAALAAAVLFGALAGTYARATQPTARRRHRSPAVAVLRPAREIAIAATAAGSRG